MSAEKYAELRASIGVHERPTCAGLWYEIALTGSVRAHSVDSPEEGAMFEPRAYVGPMFLKHPT